VKTLQIRDAKASLSAVVEAAERGEPTVITKHGRPAAMVVPVEEGHRLYRKDKPSFVEHLLGFPGPLETERDRRPLREVEF